MTAENLRVSLTESAALLASFIAGAIFLIASPGPARAQKKSEPSGAAPLIGPPPDWAP